MIAKLMTVTAASMTIAACSAQVAQTDGYLYSNSWGTSAASALDSSSVPTKQDLATTLHAPTNMSIFGTRADSPGIWLFPPNQLGGGNN
jgi:hypothetical protein